MGSSWYSIYDNDGVIMVQLAFLLSRLLSRVTHECVPTASRVQWSLELESGIKNVNAFTLYSGWTALALSKR